MPSLPRSVLLMVLILFLSGCNRDRGLEELRVLSQQADRANQQYRAGDYPTAKAALTDFVRELERRLEDPETINGETIKADLMIHYVRLAKLEEKNNGSEKDAFMNRAAANCQLLKIKRTCSLEEMRAQVDAIDALQLK